MQKRSPAGGDPEMTISQNTKQYILIFDVNMKKSFSFQKEQKKGRYQELGSVLGRSHRRNVTQTLHH